MSHEHNDGCGCSSHTHSTSQTLSELEFERGIWTAAIDGNVNKMKKLLAQGHNPNKMDKSGYTALHYAARGGCINVVTILLDNGADPNSQTPSGKTTPLHRAAYMGHLDCIKVLLAHGAKFDLVDSDGRSALHKCAEKGHYKCAELILDKNTGNSKPIVNMQDRKGNTAYQLCLQNKKNLDEWAALLSR